MEIQAFLREFDMTRKTDKELCLLYCSFDMGMVLNVDSHLGL